MKRLARIKFDLNALQSRTAWHWWGFYDPGFGWFRFGAGYWLKRLVKDFAVKE